MVKILKPNHSRGGILYMPTFVMYTAEGLAACPRCGDSFSIEIRQRPPTIAFRRQRANSAVLHARERRGVQ
ncbi:unnamed protein product [Vitrella brassicaformis CCMP3155]|uniref:Uncharacterized protein n=1 Tax=Vitrella brassicaformis (strain CCMP3155) TaxID=1169540 RepID=A0A0G4EZL2_VITBC|nr:unnamed protein product [Vitrella brassicaformis CCMP3155]|eukprot:CEM04573.1 unnamed protein product [Vitrella brassicaformis CCMP3155]